MNEFAATGGETDNRTGMIFLRFSLTFTDLVVAYRSLIRKRFIENNYKIVLFSINRLRIRLR